ncbi:MAG: replicative DNA helicase [Phycisphaerae bacterium]|nr:replicative DNA helicase [Phycisphaerae bacterium]
MPKNPTNSDQIGPLADRQVPHSLSAEMSVLGAMMLAKEAVGLVIPILKEDCFFRPEHRIIFRALVSLYQEGQPSDPVVLRRELKRMGALDQVGGPQFIAQLLSSVPSAANVEYYGKIVRDTFMLRRLIQACNDTLQETYTDALATQELLDNAEKRIFDITQDRISSGPEHLQQFLDETFKQLEERDGGLTGLATGFTELDDLTSGFQKGELIIIAARPSMGKTAFGLNVAEHVAAVEGKPSVFFSLEMSKQQVVQRMLCARAQVDSHRMRRGMLNDQEIAKLHTACDVLRDSPLFIDDTPGMSVLEMRAKSRLLKLREDVEIVFVDYLQLMSSPGAESRQQEIGMVSRGLKALARELNVPVVALAQLNRGVEGRESHRPRMSDLRESGSIEQEADLIVLLHREDYYRDTGSEVTDDSMGIAEIIIAKQRNGPVGSVQLQFAKKFTRFNNLAHIAISEAEGYVPPGAGDAPF